MIYKIEGWHEKTRKDTYTITLISLSFELSICVNAFLSHVINAPSFTFLFDTHILTSHVLFVNEKTEHYLSVP
mgnify:CR=1 FL=1